jgi:hypothetical protein
MFELLLLGLINALVIFGVNKATFFEYCYVDDRGKSFCDKYGIDKDSKMVLWFIRYWLLKTVGEFWSKPICTCPPCMASVWGTVVYWFAVPMDIHTAMIWPLYILMLSGLVALINSFTGYGNS